MRQDSKMTSLGKGSKGLQNSLMLAVAMIVLIVGIIFVLTLPSYFSSTHKILLALMILLGGGFILTMAIK